MRRWSTAGDPRPMPSSLRRSPRLTALSAPRLSFRTCAPPRAGEASLGPRCPHRGHRGPGPTQRRWLSHWQVGFAILLQLQRPLPLRWASSPRGCSGPRREGVAATQKLRGVSAHSSQVAGRPAARSQAAAPPSCTQRRSHTQQSWEQRRSARGRRSGRTRTDTHAASQDRRHSAPAQPDSAAMHRRGLARRNDSGRSR